MSKRYNELSIRMMAFTGAPFNQTSILPDVNDLEPEDFTPDVFLEELETYSKFVTKGLETFTESLRHGVSHNEEETGSDPDIEGDAGPIAPTGRVTSKTQMALSAYLLPFFLKRVSRIGSELTALAQGSLVGHLGGSISPQVTDEIRRLTQMVKSGRMPSPDDGGPLDDVLELSSGLNWTMPDLELPPSQTTGLNQPNRNVSWNPQTAQYQTAPETQPVLVVQASAPGRKKGRQATGHIKALTAAELAALMGEDEDDAPEAPPPDPPLKRMSSSFDDTKNKVFDGPEIDKDWTNSDRQSTRTRLVRKRIPTGHPNMMKSALQARLSLDEDSFDDETHHNTKFNTAT